MTFTARFVLLMLLGALPLLLVNTFTQAFIFLALWNTGLVILVIIDCRLVPLKNIFDIEREIPGRISIGRDTKIRLTVVSKIRLPLDVTIREEIPAGIEFRGLPLRFRIKGGHPVRLEFVVRVNERGVYTFGDHYVRFSTPLGMVVKELKIPSQQQARVYPDISLISRYQLLMRKRTLLEAGLVPSRILGSGTEFESLKEYTLDDEYRKIDWNATARRGKLMVRQYESERSQSVLVAVDTSRLMAVRDEGLRKIDHAVNAALLVAYVAAEKGDRVGLIVFGDRVKNFIPPGRGRKHYYSIVDALYAVEPSECEAGFIEMASFLIERRLRRSLVIVFTDFSGLTNTKMLLAGMNLLMPKHMLLVMSFRDQGAEIASRRPVVDEESLVARGVAADILKERRSIRSEIEKHGGVAMDVTSGEISIRTVNTYLLLKARSRI